MMVLAENQRGISNALKRAGAAITLEMPNIDDFNAVFKDKMCILINNDARIEISRTASKVTNGSGANLVATQMLKNTSHENYHIV